MPASAPKPLTTLSTPGGQQVGDQLHQQHDRGRRLLGRLEHDGVAGGQRRGELPGGHQQREVPRDDLADDAERLVEVVGDGVVVELARCALLGADRAGEVAEVVDGQRQVGGQASRGPACRCPRSRRRRASRGSARSGRRSCSGSRRARRPRSCPRPARPRGRRPAPARCPRRWTRATSQNVLPFTGDGFSKYCPLTGGDPLAADPVVVAGLVGDDAAVGAGLCVHSHGV